MPSSADPPDPPEPSAASAWDLSDVRMILRSSREQRGQCPKNLVPQRQSHCLYYSSCKPVSIIQPALKHSSWKSPLKNIWHLVNCPDPHTNSKRQLLLLKSSGLKCSSHATHMEGSTNPPAATKQSNKPEFPACNFDFQFQCTHATILFWILCPHLPVPLLPGFDWASLAASSASTSDMAGWHCTDTKQNPANP